MKLDELNILAFLKIGLSFLTFEVFEKVLEVTGSFQISPRAFARISAPSFKGF